MTNILDRDYYAQEALRFANQIRSEAGLSPLDSLPKGYLGWGGEVCPLGRACPGWFFQGNGQAQGFGNNKTISLPKPVSDFIHLFDQGEYSDLIIDGEPPNSKV